MCLFSIWPTQWFFINVNQIPSHTWWMLCGDIPSHSSYNLDSTGTYKLLWAPAHLPHEISSYHSFPLSLGSAPVCFLVLGQSVLCGPQGLCSCPSLCGEWLSPRPPNSWSHLSIADLSPNIAFSEGLSWITLLESTPWPTTLSHCSLLFSSYCHLKLYYIICLLVNLTIVCFSH